MYQKCKQFTCTISGLFNSDYPQALEMHLLEQTVTALHTFTHFFVNKFTACTVAKRKYILHVNMTPREKCSLLLAPKHTADTSSGKCYIALAVKYETFAVSFMHHKHGQTNGATTRPSKTRTLYVRA